MLNLCPLDVSLWQRRVDKERDLHNISDKHHRVLLHIAQMVESGGDEPTHEEVAATLHMGVRTVRDALSRSKKLELLDWDHQYRIDPSTGLRRQRANRYRWTMPSGPAVPRPDVRRRHCDCTPSSARKIEKTLHPVAYEWSARPARASLAAIAARREVQIAQQWQARRAFASG